MVFPSQAPVLAPYSFSNRPQTVVTPASASPLADAPPQYMSGPHLPSPIDAAEAGVHLVPVDMPIKANLLQKALIGADKRLIEMPKTLIKGLQGDSSYDFSDLMLSAKFPYYMGGLTMCALASTKGITGQPIMHMATAVSAYMLSHFLAEKYVHGLYRLSTGLDLGALYKDRNGKIKPLYASATFPRTDITPKSTYQAMAKRLHYPDVAQQQAENSLNHDIRSIAGESRMLSMLLGYAGAVHGAGYLARQPVIGRLSDVLARPLQAGPVSPLRKLALVIENVLSKAAPVAKAFMLPPGKAAPVTKRLAYWLTTSANTAVFAFGTLFALSYRHRHHHSELETAAQAKAAPARAPFLYNKTSGVSPELTSAAPLQRAAATSTLAPQQSLPPRGSA